MERLQGIEGVRPTAFSTAYTYHKMKEIVQEFVSEAIGKGGRILDVGCNRGHDLLRLAERFGQQNLGLYGIEVSLGDLRAAVNRAESARDLGAFHFLLSLAERMPFHDGIFDAVICSEVVEHLPDPDTAIREMSRILRPGGILALTTPNNGNKLHRLRKFLPAGLKARSDQWRSAQMQINVERGTAAGVNLPHISEHSASEWCDKMRAAGLDILDVRRGSLLFGDPYLESRPVLWAASIILDRILDRVSDDWSWQVLVKARKSDARHGAIGGV